MEDDSIPKPAPPTPRPPDLSERELQVALKELDHADKQISSYMDLQLKIVGFVLAFFGTATGLLLSTEAGSRVHGLDLPKLLVIASAVGSFGILQSAINYGIALGYMYNKTRYLAPRLKLLLGVEKSPLDAVRAFHESPARSPVMIATLTIAIGVDLLNAALLWKAFPLSAPGPITRLMVEGATALLLVVIVVQVLVGAAMSRIGIAAKEVDEPDPPGALAGTPFSGVAETLFSRLRTILVMLALAVGCLTWWMGRPLENATAKWGIASLELARNEARVAEILASWSPGARVSAVRSVTVDFVFLCLYPLAISAVCVAIAKRLATSRLKGLFVGVAWLILAAGPLDAIENIALLRLLRTTTTDAGILFAFVAANAKFLVVIIAGLCLVAGAFLARNKKEGSQE